IRPIGLVSRAGPSSDPSTWTNHVGPIGVFDGKADYEINWKDLDKNGSADIGNVTGWLGFTDKYWLTALSPDKAAMSADFRRSPSGGYQADYALAPAALAPGQTLASQTHLIAGAKEKAWLDRYEQAGIPQLSFAIDWGWFHWFMIRICTLLRFLSRSMGIFGFPFVALTRSFRGTI